MIRDEAGWRGAELTCIAHGTPAPRSAARTMTSMAQVGQDEETGTGTADLHLMLLTQQIEAMERPPNAKQPAWPWWLAIVAVGCSALLGVHAEMAYATIGRIDANSNIATA